MCVHVRASNEYPQFSFYSKNKKNVHLCKPKFYYINVGCKGVYITRTCYPDDLFGLLLFVGSKQLRSCLDSLSIT